MVYQERNIWSGMIVTVIVMTAYLIVIGQEAAAGPVADIEWWPIMLWTIGGGIVATIVVSVVWGILAGMREPDGVGRSDQRDRDISRMSDRVGQAFLVIAGIVVMVLCALEVDWFWIANAMFMGFAISALVGGIAGAIAYRRGLV